jgi:hypothetical protein
MPDLEISNLPALAEAGVAATDPLAIADLSASETKKVTVKDLIEAGVALIDNTSIPAAKIGTLGTDQVATGAIVDGAVTNVKLANSSISLGGISIALGGTDATPAFNLTDATNYPTSSLTGTITSAQLAGSIANSKLTNSSVSFGGISLALGGTDATPAFNLTDATGYKTTELVGTITNAQLAGSIDVSKLVGSTVSFGGVSVALGAADATPAFNLTDATGYPTSSLVGTITNAQLGGSIANNKLANSSVSLGGVSISLGGTDATPAFDLTDATGYPASSLVGTITNAQLAGSIDVSKLSGNTNIALGGVSIGLGGTDATPAFNLTDATNYPAASLTGTISNAQLAGSIANAKLANSSVSFGGISLALGASDATPAFDLTDATNYPTSSLTGTITNSQLAGSIAVSKLVSSSVSFGGVAVTLGTADATPAFDLQDATGYPTTALVGTITNAQLAGSIAATKLVSGSITSTQLAANSVTDSELANNAVDSGAVQNGAITNDKVETSTSATTGLDGATKVRDGSITAAKLNTSNIDRSLNVASGNLGINNVITAGTRSGITFNAQGLILSTVALGASDLPLATSSAVGGVSVGTGLSVNGSGVLSLSNSVTGATVSGITFSNSGQITAATGLVAGDLPTATTSAKGAVQITSGGGLTVTGSGGLSTSTSGVSAGTYQSVTVNNKGVVTAGATLTAALVPDLSAAKITSGTLDAARIAPDSIDSTKLSNSSTTVIQSIAQLGYPTAAFTGQLLFDPIAEDAYLWDGNAWNPITTLTKGALVRLGTYNASTSKVDYVTSAGSAAGLTVGQNLPVASDSVDGGYVVISVQGTPSGIAGITGQLSPPDYLLGVTASATSSSWVEIDLSTTVASQQASAISYTPYGQLSATNVQAVINEIEDEKLALAGGTITGQILIGNAGSLVFEGSTADAFETTLTVADPTTSDKTITLPNVTGTVITSGDTNTVTSTMVDASLVNANLAANASIAFSKLASLNSAQILVGNGSNVATAVAITGDIGINNAGLTSITAGAIVNADISSSAAITGSKITTGTTSAVGVLQLTDSTSSTSATTAATPNAVKTAYDLANTANTTANAAVEKAGDTMTGNLIIDNAKEVRFSEADSNGANYLALKAPASVTADITWTLPDGDGSANQFLKTDGSGNLSWGTDSTLDSTKLPLAGGTMSGAIAMGTSKITGLGDPTAAQDAATKTYVDTADALKLNLAGGTMSGALNMGSQNITNAGTVTGTFVGNITGNVTGNTSGSSGSCTGNAATATALATARDIGGVSFDGTAAINLPGVNASGTQDTSGNAATATKFASSVNIGGVAFDGSANINLPGVNAAGTQDTTGSAATLTTARAINGTNFDGSADITVTAAAGTLTGGTLASGVTASSLTSVGILSGLTVSGNISMTGTGVLDIPVGTTGERPGSPSTGMFRYNSTLNQFEGYKNTGWGEIGGGAGATGGSTDEVFMENDQTVTTNYTLGSNKNAVSVGNLTVNNGVTITIPTNATWVVL